MADSRLNKTGLSYFFDRIKTIFATKSEVEAVATKLEDVISEGGEPNAIDTVKVNGTELTITDKAVDVIVPTKTSDITNDSGYQTATEVESAINTAIGDLTGIDYQVVDSLPADGEKGVIYLIANSGSAPNIYDEYIYTNSTFEKIGTTDVDLTGYFNEENLVAITTAEIDEIIGA